MSMWIRDRDGNLVNMDRMSYVSIRGSGNERYVAAQDEGEYYAIFEGTEDECKAVMVSLPMPIAWDARKALS
jgi:hypothetical protein